MVVRTVLNGFTVELEVEFDIDQEPQDNVLRSLDSTDLENRDYELANKNLDNDIFIDSYSTDTPVPTETPTPTTTLGTKTVMIPN